MANTKSAQKALRSSEKKRVVNSARRSALKSSIKKLLSAISQEESEANVDLMLRSVAAQLSRATSKRLLHKNTASRTLSRLARKASAKRAE